MRRLIYLAGAAVALTLMASVLAVGRGAPAQAADPQLEKAIEDTVNAAVEAYNQADFDTFTGYFTDKGFQASFESTKAEAKGSDELFGDQLALRSLHDVKETATGATAIIEFESGLGIDAHEFTFLKQGDKWLIDNDKPATPTIDPGTRVVDLTLQEYAFVYDASALADGNVAFKVTNKGQKSTRSCSPRWTTPSPPPTSSTS